MKRRPTFGALALLAAAAILPVAAATSAPPAAEEELRRSADHILRGDGIAAEIAARAALDRGATREEVAAFMGEAKLIQGEGDEALQWLQPAQFAPASAPRGFHALGRALMDDGKLPEAAAALDRALQLGGASAALWVDIASLRYRSGQQQLVPEAVEAALSIDPQDTRALVMRAFLARDAEGPVAALPWFERALEAKPADAELLANFGATLADAGRHRQALQVARRIAEIDPQNPRSFYLNAVIAARAGQYDLAGRLLSRTEDHYADVPAAQVLRAILELQAGNAALAVNSLDAVARAQPENRRVRQLLGRALLANGDANEVVARFETFAARPDAEPYLLVLVGRAYEQMGDRARAAEYLDRAVQPLPQQVSVLPVLDLPWNVIGFQRSDTASGDVPQLRRLLTEGRGPEAIAAAEALRLRYPASSDVERLYGDVLLLTGAPDLALQSYERAARIRTDLQLALRMFAAERLAARPERALARIAQFDRQHPGSPSVAALLGREAAARGDLAAASAFLASASRLTQDADPRLLKDLANVRRSAGAAAEADALMQRAARLQRWAILAPLRSLPAS